MEDESERSASARRTRTEVEQLMLDTASRVVLERGLTVGFDHLRMDDLIREAGVPKSSVYRRWPTKELFLADFLPLLAYPLSSMGAAYDEQTQKVATQVLQTNVHRMGTREGRIAVVREAVRLAVDQNFAAMNKDGRWRAYAALVATASNSDDEGIRNAVTRAVKDADQSFVGAMATFYDQILPWAHARFREGVTSMHLAATGAAVVEGLVSRNGINPDLANPKIQGPALDGGTVEWSLAATGFFGVLMQLVEFDEDDPTSKT
jgi:AcrR family transcriptional regulator